MEILTDRAVIEIRGKDKFSFLQGIITNDIDELEAKKCLFTLILTPQGKFLYEVFFFYLNEDIIYMDCFAEQADKIISHLNKYKLRSDVEFSLKKDLKIYWSKEQNKQEKILENIDPRRQDIGYRGVTMTEEIGGLNAQYNSRLCELCIPNCHYDMKQERTFPMEYGMDHLNAISFTKGCFVGQELTARMKYRKMVKKTLYRLTFQDDLADPLEDVAVYNQDKKIGEIIGRNGVYAIALIRDEEYMEVAGTDKENFTVNGFEVAIETPHWKRI